jgi:hypothetical protein
MATPITTKDLGKNPETGLQEILKVWKVNIDAEIELITVGYKIYTISPTGVEIKESQIIEYGRYNHPSNMAFDNWRNSLIGKGIAQAIEGTIVNYPNINQIIEEEEINSEEIKEN